MRPTPATIGANVRTTGMNRASTMVLAPCLVKNASVRWMYSCLKSFESGLRMSRRADSLAECVAHLVAGKRRNETPEEQEGEAQAELALGSQEPSGEQQRVAGEEKPDE